MQDSKTAQTRSLEERALSPQLQEQQVQVSTQVSSSESENFGNNPPQQTDSLAFQLDNILKEEEEEIIFERTFPDSKTFPDLKIQKNASESN